MTDTKWQLISDFGYEDEGCDIWIWLDPEGWTWILRRTYYKGELDWGNQLSVRRGRSGDKTLETFFEFNSDHHPYMGWDEAEYVVDRLFAQTLEDPHSPMIDAILTEVLL